MAASARRGRRGSIGIAAVTEPATLQCPITGRLLRNPVLLGAGHTTYERAAVLAAWAMSPDGRPRCPVRAFLLDHPGYVPTGWDSRELPDADADEGSAPGCAPPASCVPSHAASWAASPRGGGQQLLNNLADALRLLVAGDGPAVLRLGGGGLGEACVGEAGGGGGGGGDAAAAAALATLCAAAESSPRPLAELHLADSGLGFGACASLAAHLRRPGCKLSVLDLSNNPCVCRAAATELASALQPRGSLVSLLLCRCPVGDAGAIALAAAARRSQLQRLGLAAAGVGPLGAAALAAALGEPAAALRSLDVSHNDLGGGAVAAFAAALRSAGPRLEELRISVTDAGARSQLEGCASPGVALYLE